MAVVKRRALKPRSLAAYREKIELHVVPHLGKMRLDKITARHIDELYEAKIEAGLSSTTLAAVHARLANLLKLAKRRKLVSHVATDEVEPPKVRKYDARILTIDEAKTLLRGVAEHRHGPFWTLILGTGCRFGEAAGLGLHDVDDAGVARIYRVVNQYMDGGKLVVSIDPAPKSEAGKREIPLPSWALAAVEAQRKIVDDLKVQAGKRWRDPVDRHGNTIQLLFPNSLGGPLRENRLNELWHAVLRDLKLEGQPGQTSLRMHDLRHSKGTIMADEGEDLVVIQRTLGHAKSSITADLYVGRVPKALRRAAERWGVLLDPSETSSAVGETVAAEASPEAVS
jgi:integrase